jgi:hypothetical protein
VWFLLLLAAVVIVVAVAGNCSGRRIMIAEMKLVLFPFVIVIFPTTLLTLLTGRDLTVFRFTYSTRRISLHLVEPV